MSALTSARVSESQKHICNMGKRTSLPEDAPVSKRPHAAAFNNAVGIPRTASHPEHARPNSKRPMYGQVEERPSARQPPQQLSSARRSAPAAATAGGFRKPFARAESERMPSSSKAAKPLRPVEVEDEEGEGEEDSDLSEGMDDEGEDQSSQDEDEVSLVYFMWSPKHGFESWPAAQAV